MDVFAILDLKLSSSDAHGYRLSLGFAEGAAEVPTALADTPCAVNPLLERLPAQASDALAYGRALADSLFADAAARAALVSGQARAASLQRTLRVRLWLPGKAEALQLLAWERLCDPITREPLFLGPRPIFTRHVQARDHPGAGVPSEAGLARALVVPAGAADDAALDAQRTFAQAVLGDLSTHTVVLPAEAEPADLASVLQDAPDLLLLTCLGPDLPRFLSAAALNGAAFPRLPRLVVVHCLGPADAEAVDPLALGAPLVRAGAAAVLVLPAVVSAETATIFLSVFFEEVRRHGFPERAAAQARAALHEAPDGTLPALFSRLVYGYLWEGPTNELLRLKMLLAEALALPDARRASYVAAACAGDNDLRARLEALLREVTPDTAQLRQAFHAPIGTKTGAETGRRIGPYRLMEELGRGGMGVVYRAVRDDGELQMTVAVKLIKHNRAAPEFVARFRRERQLLADLRHPHIAQLLDAGTTSDGMPYLIMDYVDGTTVTRWCRTRNLAPGPCLELFRKLLQAVAMAHRKGVIHRDIKPANVLVTAEGTPVLLDFGIAHTVATHDTSSLTQTGQMVMTPAYAAPEQRQGANATPAFDIYALGLLLHEMLTGERPPRAETPAGLPTGETAVDATLFPPNLQAFLDTALAESPRLRYASCEDMIADVDLLLGEMGGRHGGGDLSSVGDTYDVLLLAGDADREVAQEVAQRLAGRALRVCLPVSTKEAAAASLETSTCLLCVGPGDEAPWSDASVRLVLAQRVRSARLQVVPLLLPHAHRPERESDLPFFLRRLTWLTFPEKDAQWDTLVDFLAARETDATLGGHAPSCPFRGLEVFREEDAAFFFGREAITQRLEEHLRHHAFLAVLGPSGSGKSSLVRAGLLPLLRARGVVPVLFTPHVRPLEELAFALQALYGPDQGPPVEQLHRRLTQDERALHFMVRELRDATGIAQLCLTMDQFEELFTLAAEEERRIFLLNLLHALDLADEGFRCVLTMRSDFIGQCVTWPDFNHYVSELMVQVPPLDAQELTRAVVEPARLAGLVFEPGLVEVIINEVTGAAGELPLLEHALLELYERRHGQRLTLAAYAEIGGIEGALAQRAESEFQRLDAEQRQVLRKMFTLCLVHPGEGVEDTRRRATREELSSVGTTRETAEALLTRWTQKHLFTGSRDATRGLDLVDVAHEALIRKWDRIKAWMAEDRETARLLGRLRRRATAWEESGHHADFLPRGGQLYQFQELESREPHLGELERRYIAAGMALERRLRRLERRTRNVMTGLSLGTMILAVVTFFLSRDAERSVAAAAVAARLTQSAETAAARADYARQDANYNLGLAFNVKAGDALENGRPEAAWLASLSALTQDIPADKDLPGPRGRFFDPRMQTMAQLWCAPVAPRVNHLAVSADGRLLAVAARDGEAIHLMDTRTGRQLADLSTGYTVLDMAFHPDGTRLTVASEWEIHVIHTSDFAVPPLRRPVPVTVTCLAYSGDGARLAVGGDDGTVHLLDLEGDSTPRLMGRHGTRVWDVVFRADDRAVYAATSSGIARMDVVSGAVEPVAVPISGAATVLALRPGGRLLSGWADGSVVFHDASGPVVSRLQSKVRALVAEADGRVFASDRGGLWVWAGPGQGPEAVVDTTRGKRIRSFCRLSPGTLIGHTDDGRLFACNGADGKVTYPAMGHASTVSSVAFSPDGRLAGTASRDGTIGLWEVHGDRAPRFLRGHTSAVTDMAFSPDGTLAASSSDDGSVGLWRMADGVRVGTWTGHTGGVNGVAFSPDGRLVASAGADGTVRVTGLDGAVAQVLKGHKGAVQAVAFSPDGRLLAACGDDAGIHLFPLVAPHDVRVLRGHGKRVYGLAFSPDGGLLASASHDETVRVWRLPEGRPAWVFRGHQATVRGVAFSPDGRRVASASDDETVRLWDVVSGVPGAVLQGHVGAVHGVAFSPEGFPASSSADRTVRFWQPGYTPTQNVLNCRPGRVLSAAFSPDGRRLVSASGQQVRLWAVPDGRELRQFPEFKDRVSGVAFSPDGTRIASTSIDGTGRIHSLKGAEPSVVLHHPTQATGVAFSHDGRFLATGCKDHQARIWRVADGGLERSLSGHTASVFGVAFSPDGNLLATGSMDRTVRLWSLDEDAAPRVCRGHSARVVGVAFSPDGRLLATASHDQTVRLWDVGDGTEVRVLRGHTHRAYGVAFSPDGRRLATTSADGSARLWDTATGEALVVLEGHTGEVNWQPAFSPDGALLATPSDDGTIRLWPMHHLPMPPDGTEPRVYYAALLARSLYHLGYGCKDFSLFSRPHMLMTPAVPGSVPEPHLDRPRPAHLPLDRWLMLGNQAAVSTEGTPAGSN